MLKAIKSAIAKYRAKRDMPVGESFGSLLRANWLITSGRLRIGDDNSAWTIEDSTASWVEYNRLLKEYDRLCCLPDLPDTYGSWKDKGA